MESHPEEDDDGEDEEQRHEAAVGVGLIFRCLLTLGFDHLLLNSLFLLRGVVDLGEGPAEAVVNGDGDDEREAGYAESIVVSR